MADASGFSQPRELKQQASKDCGNSSVPRVHIVGQRNSGKTTLVCQLIKWFCDTGLQVATVKHTHHSHELDTPGKDSHQHRLAGAASVGILSNHLTAVFVPQQQADTKEQRYVQLQQMFPHCDLIIVEGDLHTTAPKLEVWRSEISDYPYAKDHSSIYAVITDDDCPGHTTLARSDLAGIAKVLLQLAHLPKKSSLKAEL